ncbi:LysR substrate-binding domain-containing protein [Microbacterium sp. 1P10UB]|uniref:LysR substrate-binding domain-containing protein n=1 Tax=Microbacterium sp. 1P10UB TaxID=3132287 RepID=UPI0039A29222
MPGATPGKWIALWRERVPHVPLELVPLTVDAQLDALRGDEVDAAIVRLPLAADDVHRIALYEEIPVVVVPVDSALTAADDLGVDDLVGEVRHVPVDDVLAVDIPGTLPAAAGPPLDTEAAVATVAAGVGILVVPMSIARLHARKDVAHRPLRDGPVSSVALAWPAERTTSEVETFIGIVRGRTANSSR